MALLNPASQNGANAQTLQATAATDLTSGQIQPVIQVFDQFDEDEEFVVTITNTDDDTDAADIEIISGLLGTGNMPAATTLTSSVGNHAATKKWLENVSMSIVSFRIETTNVANYEGNYLTIGKQKYTGRHDQNRVYLSKYRVSAGNGYSDVVDVKDRPFTTIPQTFMTLKKLKFGTTVNIYFKIQGVSDAAQVKLVKGAIQQ